MGGGFRREETYTCLWLIHVGVWQKPAQYCKAIICQLKKKREMANKYMGQTTKDLYNTREFVFYMGSDSGEVRRDIKGNNMIRFCILTEVYSDSAGGKKLQTDKLGGY